MTLDTCRYCFTPLDVYGKPMGDVRQLPSVRVELCFACGSMVIKETDAARHCACPHCAEREFRQWPISYAAISLV